MKKNVKPKLIFIAGGGRSGSTLLSIVISDLAKFENVGELYLTLLDQRIRAREIPCSCGEPVDLCPKWAAFFQNAKNYDFSSYATKNFFKRTEYKNFDLIDEVNAKVIPTECKGFVESSKNIGVLNFLEQSAKYEISVIHILRDPRATVSAWMTKNSYLKIKNFSRALHDWVLNNYACTIFCKLKKVKYTKVHYEDLLRSPEVELVRIFSDIGVKIKDQKALEFNEYKIDFSEHTISGNPMKLASSGGVSISRGSFKKINKFSYFESLILKFAGFFYGYK